MSMPVPIRLNLRMRLRHALPLMALAFGMGLLSLPAAALAEPLKIRFAHVVAQDTPKGLAVERFKTLVAERSGGRMVVEVYAGSSVYGDLDEMQALQAGAVEMLAPSLSKFGRVGFPEFELFDLPYLFDTLQDVHRITDGPLGARLLKSLERQGMVGLGFLDNGFKHMSANRPLLRPADFSGLRMRVQTSRVIAAQMRALGAVPVQLPFGATRQALARQVVQGTENPLSNFWTQGMHRVQSDLTLTGHAYLGYAVVTGQRFWRSLSPGDQRLLREALNDALRYGNQIADSQNSKALVSLRQAGTTAVHEPSAAQRQLLRDTVQTVHQQLGQRIGPQWIQDAHAALHRP
ncbi:DctP family TRAP transporter solute-binding subunit [Hydrogenophaga sp. PAMC20947]|uniref:DctP family TRAP transporter solute-binding subunit n=1 Tax=Hydrogenophaga sp. PAMC20947 TaxID=2565558 RepID=UPI001FFBE9E0|nr:DctP family TRAP transporter solute-binding subunit [Hydrogenophaga sp. PAMC20947]